MSTDLDAFTEIILSRAEVARTVLSNAMYQEISKLVNAPNAKARYEAKRLAQEAAKNLLSQMTKQQIQGIGDAIEDAKQYNGDKYYKMMKNLNEVTDVNPRQAQTLRNLRESLKKDGVYSKEEISAIVEKKREECIRYRKKMIAATEKNRVTSIARDLKARLAGATHKIWATSGASNVCQAICASNQSSGFISISSNFQNGSSYPPAHPWCACKVNYKRERKVIV